jgi:hypothetical protein
MNESNEQFSRLLGQGVSAAKVQSSLVPREARRDSCSRN